MKFTLIAFSGFATIVQGNSNLVSLYASEDAWIQEASATLILPPVPRNVTGDVSIWSAIMMENDASFLQGISSNSPNGSFCNDGGASWCNFAYALVGSNSTVVGDAINAGPGSAVKTHYKLNNSTNLWDQKLYVDGKLASQVSTSKSQHGMNFYISIECAGNDTCASIPAHSWQNVSIVLSEPDPSFDRTVIWAHNATGGNMSSPDGGKIWNLTTLHVPTQQAKEARVVAKGYRS